MTKRMIVVILAALLSGCMSPKSYFFPPEGASVGEKGVFTISDPKETIVVLYTPGSADNDTLGSCGPTLVPAVLQTVKRAPIGGKAVLVHMYCSLAVGSLGAGLSMSEARAPDLDDVVREYQRQGVPAKQIFVAGHSMGGWAAILVAARKKVEIGGAIVFAPANGVWTRDRRTGNHWAAYARQKGALEGVSNLNALVYLFHGDPYNGPEDLDFMKNIAGVEFLALRGNDIGNGGCANGSPHNYASSHCFNDAENSRIYSFIKRTVSQ